MYRLLCLIFFAFLPAVTMAMPTQKAIDSLGLEPHEVDWLIMHPVIRLGVNKELPPYDYIDDNAQYQGVLAQYIHHFEELLGVKFKIIKAGSKKELLELIKNDKLDVISGVEESPESQKLLHFSSSLFSIPLGVVVRSDKPIIESIEEFKDATMGVVESSMQERLLRDKFPQATIVPVATTLEGLNALQLKKFDLFVGENPTLLHYLQTKDMSNLYLGHTLEEKYRMHLGIHKDLFELSVILQKALGSITREQREHYFSQWITQESAQQVKRWYWVSLSINLIALIFLGILYVNRKNKKEEVSGLTRQLSLKNSQLETVVKGMKVGTWIWSLEDDSNVINEQYALMLGYKKDEIPEMFDSFMDLVHPDDVPLMLNRVKRYFDGIDSVYKMELRLRQKSGTYRWVLSYGEVIRRNSQGEPALMIGYHADIHNQKVRDEEVRHFTIHDALTKLYNHRFYYEVVPLEIRRARREYSGFVLGLIRLENLQAMNKNENYRYGDSVLVFVAEYLKEELKRPSDMVFRMSGTVFAITFWCDRYDDSHETIKSLEEGLLKAFKEQEHNVKLKLSCGFSFMMPGSLVEEETLYAQARASLEK